VSDAHARGALYSHSDVTQSLQAPLTLGIARVVLRSGAVSRSTTQGLRVIMVESGMLAVGMPRNNHAPITAADLSASPRVNDDLIEIIMATGTSLTADDPGIMSLRNPGAGSTVLLDVVVYRASPQPFSRAFTNDEISFQLLASAVARSAPSGGATVRLERTWLAPQQVLVQAAGTGVTVRYLERGAIQVTGEAGEVATARAAAAAPFSLPGAPQKLEQGRERLVTAGGMVFVPQDGAATVKNTERRDAELLVLSVLAA
jgi:hypothetical protein